MAIERYKLTAEDKKVLEGLASDVNFLELEIERMERAGIDTKDMRDRLSKAKALREGLLREYGE